MPLEVFCLVFMLYMTSLRHRFEKCDADADDQKAWLIQKLGSSIAFIAIIINAILLGHSGRLVSIVALCRPVVILSLFKGIRGTFYDYVAVVKHTIPMGMVIVTTIVYFTWVAKNLFKGKSEGLATFPSWFDGLYNMLILLTTANFPDMMLPAYEDERTKSWIFPLYLTLIFFVFLNLMLAIVYSKF